jgi:hypothetical protein
MKTSDMVLLLLVYDLAMLFWDIIKLVLIVMFEIIMAVGAWFDEVISSNMDLRKNKK